MNRKTANKLIDELRRHATSINPVVDPKRKKFIDTLVSANVPEPDVGSLTVPRNAFEPLGFHEIQTNETQLIKELKKGRYHYFSLTYIVRNGIPQNARMPQPKRVNKITCDALRTLFGCYATNSLYRDLTVQQIIDLTAHPELTRMLATCQDPFSLLGRLETYDFNNKKGILFVLARPVLVIPGVGEQERKPIHDWEQRNTTYHRETDLLRLLKMVKPEEYHSYTAN